MYSHSDPLNVTGWMAQPAILWHSRLTPCSPPRCPPGLRCTQGFYQNHVLPPRPSKSYRVDVTVSYIVSQLATPIFSHSLSHWTWDIFLTSRSIQGFYLNHVLPPRSSKSYRLDGTASYPHVLPLAVHLDLGHLPDTQGYSGILSEPCTTTQTL